MWAALAKGAMKVGRGASMAKKVFKGKGRKDVSASQQTVDVEASPAVSKPTTPLISSSSTFDAKNISKPTAAIGKEIFNINRSTRCVPGAVATTAFCVNFI